MKLGVIGCGKMGASLVRGIVAKGVCDPRELSLADAYAPAAETLAEELEGAVVCEGVLDCAEGSDVVLVCVKPGDVRAVLESLAEAESDPLVVSIAAGVTLASLGAWAGASRRIARVMPNTPALVGKGASAYVLGGKAAAEDARTVEALLGAVGTVVAVKEGLMDAVTGLSGSGPAYVYTMIEALADGGVQAGLPREIALALAAQTVAGGAAMVQATGLHPAVLRDQVTSPGGTTIAGVAALEAHGFRSALIGAVAAAAARSKELGD
ncbi:pyrroline-5-carboxylate reductase [soil metagenome]